MVSVNNLPEEAMNATWRDRLLKPRAKSKKLIMALWHYTVATSRTDIQDLGMSRLYATPANHMRRSQDGNLRASIQLCHSA